MAKQERVIEYAEYLWVQVDDNILTIGLNDQALENIDRIRRLQLPPENEEVLAEEVCGELETDDGAVDLYSPVKGIVTEVNEAVMENPDLIIEDPFGEGWIFRVETEDTDAINEFVAENQAAVNTDVDDDDDDKEDDDDLDEDDDGPRGRGGGDD